MAKKPIVLKNWADYLKLNTTHEEKLQILKSSNLPYSSPQNDRIK